MKAAIVYYSMDGNTAMVAGKLAESLPADLIRINPACAYPDKGIRKFLRGGKSAVMEETPALEPYMFSAEKYDLVVFGSPVWASNITPPVRTFIRDNLEALKGKKIAAFACESGSGGDKALDKLTHCLERSTLTAAMVLINPKGRPEPVTDQKIAAFLKQLQG